MYQSLGDILGSPEHNSYIIVIVIGHYITLAHDISLPSVATSILSESNVRLAEHVYAICAPEKFQEISRYVRVYSLGFSQPQFTLPFPI